MLALLVGAPACWSVPEVDRREIRPWLICGDCTDGELARVVALGERAERYLRAAIADGPTRADDSVMTAQLEEGVTRARRYRSDRGILAPLSSTDSVGVIQRQLDDFRLRYRLRAVQALRQIDARSDSSAVLRLCADPPPELVRQAEFRAQFAPFGTCP